MLVIDCKLILVVGRGVMVTRQVVVLKALGSIPSAPENKREMNYVLLVFSFSLLWAALGGNHLVANAAELFQLGFSRLALAFGWYHLFALDDSNLCRGWVRGYY